MTEDFKQLSVKTGFRHGRSKWWADKGYAEQMQAFIKSIREGSAPPVTVLDGARATVGCLRMLESARSGNACTFDLSGFR